MHAGCKLGHKPNQYIFHLLNYLVFGCDIPNEHDLITAQELYRDFNADEVDVYLKERREQVVDVDYLRTTLAYTLTI